MKKINYLFIKNNNKNIYIINYYSFNKFLI